MAVLIEASARVEGPSGLAESMTLLNDFVQTFWDLGLYPSEDDDGVSSRYQPLSGLSGGGGDKDGALIQPIRRMVLAAVGGDQLRYLDKVRADAVMASAQTGSPEQKAARMQEAEAAYHETETLAQRLPRRSLSAASEQVGAAETSWRAAIAYIGERTKPHFPAASRVSDELAAIREWLDSLLARMAPDVEHARVDEPSSDEAAPAGAAAATAEARAFVPGKITTREDALRAVAAAAEYFQRYEPHSPLGASLREVDRRARMSLHDFLAELIPDESVRQTYYWRSGIKPPVAENGAE
jgi:type VI secretion system protein ImpA